MKIIFLLPFITLLFDAVRHRFTAWHFLGIVFCISLMLGGAWWSLGLFWILMLGWAVAR